MAKYNSSTNSVTVEKGDTLSQIALDYKQQSGGLTYKQIAKLNDISNPDRIAIGQVIRLSGKSTGTSTATNSNQAKIKQFGIQSDTDGKTIFATWDWSKSNTENYEVEWCYDSGDKVWFYGNTGTEDKKQSTYSIPENAKRIRFRVKPISKTYTKNNKTTTYWTASWSTAKYYTVKDGPPAKPTSLSVKVEKYTLTAEVDLDLDANAKEVEFKIVRDDKYTYKKGTAKVVARHAAYSCTLKAGHKFKVCARSVRDGLYSEWEGYSSNYETVPNAPSKIKSIRALSRTSVNVDWTNVSTAKTYEIQYTDNKSYFNSSNEVKSQTVNADEAGHAEITGLEEGKEYFFRVRAVNDQGNSEWTPIKSIILGRPPEAPTTWSSTTTAIVNEPMTLYWIHNAEDGSKQTYAEVEIIVNGVTSTYTVNTTDSTSSEDEEKTYSYPINTADYGVDANILWRVRTAGITKEYGEWSVQREIDIYAPPTSELNVINKDGEVLEVIESFPFYVSCLTGPDTQMPVGYHLSVISNETYETVDDIGNRITISNGESIYSKYFDINDPLMVEISANNINLENGVTYKFVCTASMDSGLTSDSSVEIPVAWSDNIYEPNAEINVDLKALVAHIHPYCEEYKTVFYEVSEDSGIFTKTATILDISEGVSLEDTDGNEFFTETDEQVFTGTTTTGIEVYYCTVEEKFLSPDVTLSVYRREFDGSFTEIATGIDNLASIFVTDPHPALDYARYRIVATTKTTGAVSYYDLPGYPMGETAVIIQWDEEWTNFNITEEDELEEPLWSGSLLRLPYNIDVADSNQVDVSNVNYIGRKYPVSYYGTQLGSTSSWAVEIPKDDKETLYAIRRLSTWTGDVYVREPSGSGYWATISVSLNINHCQLTIPVTFSITRVEGGV